MQVRGNSDGERRTLTYLAPNPNLTAVDSSDVLDDRKAKSVTSIGPAASVVNSVKTFEDPVNLSSGDADPVVGDGDLDVVIIAPGLHMRCHDNTCSGVGVGNRIL